MKLPPFVAALILLIVIYAQNAAWINRLATVSPGVDSLHTQLAVLLLEKQVTNSNFGNLDRQNTLIIVALEKLTQLTSNFCLSFNICLLLSLFLTGYCTFNFLRAQSQSSILPLWGAAFIVAYFSAAPWLVSLPSLAAFIIPLAINISLRTIICPTTQNARSLTTILLLAYLCSYQIYLITIVSCFTLLVVNSTLCARRELANCARPATIVVLGLTPLVIHLLSGSTSSTSLTVIPNTSGHILSYFFTLPANKMWGAFLANPAQTIPAFPGLGLIGLLLMAFFFCPFFASTPTKIDLTFKLLILCSLAVVTAYQLFLCFAIDDFVNSGNTLGLLLWQTGVILIFCLYYFPRKATKAATWRTNLSVLLTGGMCAELSLGLANNDKISFFYFLAEVSPDEFLPLQPFMFTVPFFCLMFFVASQSISNLRIAHYPWSGGVLALAMLFNILELRIDFATTNYVSRPRPIILNQLSEQENANVLFLPLVKKGVGDYSVKQNIIDFHNWTADHRLRTVNDKLLATASLTFLPSSPLNSFPRPSALAAISELNPVDYVIYLSEQDPLFDQSLFEQQIRSADFPFKLVAKQEGAYLFGR